ncbi:hypothetical protein MIMGU_mgv1a018661mg [Erythranthe guttata]|uniref:Uncharacterized protein n=1 Tax=Erythranthe guttata TaxID=4155 RepID=A0A022QLT2_ERYGU|nr:hypothetical protein MIMGU_mgv1a018661mg [Erythranthe guttata]
MERKDEKEVSFSRLKFPLLPLPADTVHYSPEHLSGTATPPLHTLASVPFKWEEQPGKPRPCTDIIALPEPTAIKCLDLPPCRTKLPKLPSPTAVLDGPYNLARPKFSSFRFFREARAASFDSSSSGGGGGSPLSSVDVLIGKKSSTTNGGLTKTRRLFNFPSSTLRSCNKSGADGGSLGFSPSSGDERCKTTTMRRNGSFSSLAQAAPTHHHLWGSIYESLKQAVAWKSTRKSKKERIRMKEQHHHT